jgi:hypothetical protein
MNPPPPETLFGIFAGLGAVALIIAALTSLFWIWMIIDCATNQRISGNEKVVWLLVIFFLHFLGALIYFFVGRSGRAGATP